MPETLTAAQAIQKLEEAAHRARSEETAARIVATAKTRLILAKDAKSVFFATLVMRLKFQANWDLETAATDGRKLFYNPDFVQTLTDKELVALLAHEVLHCTNKHCLRIGERDPKDWNIACDLAINPLLKESGFTLPAGHLMPGDQHYQKLKPGLSAEEYYAALQEPEPPQQPEPDQPDQPGEQDDQNGAGDPESNQASDQSGDDSDQLGPGDQPGDQPGSGAPDPGQCGGVIAPTDDNDSPVEACEAKALDQEWNANVAAAQQAAQRSRGTLPAGIERLCAEVLAPMVDWKAALREFITRPSKNNYSWRRPSRRHIHAGLFLPSLNSLELGHIVVAVDTSGSITDATLQRFASELDDIARQGTSRITIVYHDSDVVRVDEWTPEDGPLTLTPCGGGGTDHKPVFEWIDQNIDEPPAALVCLTDLVSDFPSDQPDYPVLWASTDRQQPHPFGERIDIPEE